MRRVERLATFYPRRQVGCILSRPPAPELGVLGDIGAPMTIRNHVVRGTLIGALIGAAVALAIFGEYRREIAAGISPAGAGLGGGILSWIASFPLGLVVIYALVTPVLDLIHYRDSRTTNMVLILMFGVVGNWALIGALVGIMRRLRESRVTRTQRSAPHAT